MSVDVSYWYMRRVSFLFVYIIKCILKKIILNSIWKLKGRKNMTFGSVCVPLNIAHVILYYIYLAEYSWPSEPPFILLHCIYKRRLQRLHRARRYTKSAKITKLLLSLYNNICIIWDIISHCRYLLNIMLLMLRRTVA